MEAPPPPPPPRTTYTQTIYIFAVPEEESDTQVANFLCKSGLRTTTEFRKLYIPDTVIPGFLPNGFWNGGRSVVVEAAIGTKIPGFACYALPTLKFAPKINIWYPRMGDWCRSCLAEGHRASSCPKKMRHLEALADKFKNLTEWKDLQNKLKLDYADKIVPFFTWKDPFSNHHPCDVEVEGVHYKSTEHCLIAQHVHFCGDSAAAEEIQAADTAAKAMKKGKQVPFPGGTKPWHIFAKKALEAANLAKFMQNASLHQHLFTTCGKRLVEASTDPYWGCGHALDVLNHNSKLHHPDEWRGFNIMGDILTHLRQNLMGDKEYYDEAKAIREEENERRASKRPRESPGVAGPTETKRLALQRMDSQQSVNSEY